MVSPSTGRFLHTMLMLAGLLASYWLYKQSRTKLALSEDHKRFLSLAALLGAFIGAKLPFLLEKDWSGLSPWIHWLSDGKTVLGGIFGGYVSVELTKACLGIRQGTGDAFAVPIAAGLSIGRLGCFVGGCCFGVPTQLPWGVAFPLAPDQGMLLRHPIQVYETIFHALALVLLVFMHRWQQFTGHRLKIYLLSYLVFRFFTELIRPEPLVAVGLTAYQIACIVLALGLCLQFFMQSRSASVASRVEN